MTEKVIGYILAVIIMIVFMLVVNGCQSVESTNRVVYEDKTPVVRGNVLQWNDETDLRTLTDSNGTWTFTVPVNEEYSLCIEDPNNSNTLYCYDGLLTVDEFGELQREQ